MKLAPINFISRAADDRYHRLVHWHPWFAWRPVWVAEHDCRWLEWIERKGAQWAGSMEKIWCWSYRAKGSDKD